MKLEYLTQGTGLEMAVWAAAYILAILGSGPWVIALLRAAGQTIPEGQKNPGRIIGRLEDFLVVTLVILEAYTALALIFAAKGIARAEGDRPNASYYILGTLANFTWALAVALAARLALRALL